MRGRGIHVVGQALQHVADIDHDGVSVRGKRDPFPRVRAHFQPFCAGTHQQGDEVDVLVRARAFVRYLRRGDRRVVDRPQDRVAAVGLVGKEVRRQADVQRQRRQHPRTQLVERGVQPVGDLAELRDLLRPQVRRHDVGVARVARDLATDVPELLEVEMRRALGGLHAEGGVAAGAAAARHVVLALDLVGKREEALEHVVGGVDLPGGNPMPADAGEAPFPVGRAQFGDEGVAIAFETADIQGRDAGRGHAGTTTERDWTEIIGRASCTARCRRQPAAARTASASRSSWAWTRSPSSASTVTRTTGSVPDGRRKARPLPCTAACTSASTARTESASAGLAPLANRTFTVRCGTLTSPASASRSPIPRRESTSSTCNALTMPSPVLARSKHSRWPDASPPSVPPLATSCWWTWRSPTLARMKPIPACANACSSPKLVISVPTTGPCNRPLACQSRASTYSRSSPSQTAPLRSTNITRSPSPSNAMPRSAPVSRTRAASVSGWVEPTLSLMLRPLGSTPIASTWAPSSRSTSGPIW